jgi:hypothetical protein
MAEFPRISVAMSVYNGAPFLAEAIESILAQSFGDYEFLIVNDGSRDRSAEIINAFAARDPRIRAIHQDNRGLVASLNRLVEEARAPLIARMDGDDISLPERFARQIAFLDAHPDHGVVGASTHDIDEEGRLTRNEDYHPLDHDQFLRNLGDGPLLCHPSVMMRRDVVRDAGGYRRQFVHCEDYDLWLRLSGRTKLCSIPDRLLHYRRSDTQVSSAYVLTQQIGAAVAWLAHRERAEGRPDPTEGLDALPPIDGLDALFGREGVAREVRSRVAPTLVYSEEALRAEGLDLLVRHIREGGDRSGLWRTAARLVKFGEPARAVRLAAALATG